MKGESIWELDLNNDYLFKYLFDLHSTYNICYLFIYLFRCRLERYKEERRSMLRSKYKAEDYLTSEKNAEKKKVSQVGSLFFMSALCNLFTGSIFLETEIYFVHQKLQYPHLTPVFRIHNIHLEFSTCLYNF